MNESNIALAEAYYKALVNKDLKTAESHLHPDVHFVAPMGESRGRDKVIEAAKRLVPLLKGVDIRARFSAGDQVALIYDMKLTAPVDICPTAVYMTFKDGLIARTELFYDARPFGNL